MKHKLFFFITALIFSSAISVLADVPDTLWCKYTYPTQINCVKFTPDGLWLATAGSDGVDNIWNVATGDTVKSFPCGGTKSIDIYQNLIAFTGGGGTSVYNLITNSLLFKGLAALVVRFSTDGNYLITSNGTDSTKYGVTIYDTKTWEKIRSIDIVYIVSTLDISPDNKHIAVANYWSSIDNKTPYINIYSFPNLTYERTLLQKDLLETNYLKFSDNNQYLAGALGSDGDNIWNTSDWSLYKNLNQGSDSRCIAFSPDNKYFVTGGDTLGYYTTNICEISSGTIKYRYNNRYLFDQSDWDRSIDVNNQGNIIAFGGDGGIYVLNAKWNSTLVQDDPVQIINPIIFPNPTNGMANIQFNLLQPSQVNINIYDALSNLVAPIFNGQLSQGMQNFQWNASTVASGIYYCNITTGSFTSTIQIIVNK